MFWFPFMNIPVREDVWLSPFEEADVDGLVRCLSEPDIHRTTALLPYPYTEKDARQWIDLTKEKTAKLGYPLEFVIRHREDNVIGAIGFKELIRGQSFRSEIGYWLSKPLWGQGIATDAVAAICRHGFDDFNLVKITAHTFRHNPASGRVLEKNGFVVEGNLRKHHKKDDRLIDIVLYAKFND